MFRSFNNRGRILGLSHLYTQTYHKSSMVCGELGKQMCVEGVIHFFVAGTFQNDGDNLILLSTF